MYKDIVRKFRNSENRKMPREKQKRKITIFPRLSPSVVRFHFVWHIFPNLKRKIKNKENAHRKSERIVIIFNEMYFFFKKKLFTLYNQNHYYSH